MTKRILTGNGSRMALMLAATLAGMPAAAPLGVIELRTRNGLHPLNNDWGFKPCPGQQPWYRRQRNGKPARY